MVKHKKEFKQLTRYEQEKIMERLFSPQFIGFIRPVTLMVRKKAYITPIHTHSSPEFKLEDRWQICSKLISAEVCENILAQIEREQEGITEFFRVTFNIRALLFNLGNNPIYDGIISFMQRQAYHYDFIELYEGTNYVA